MSVGGSTLRLGIIGAGFISQVAHIHSFARVKGVQLVAIAEAHDDLRKKVAVRHNIPRTFRDHRELLEDPEIDAVVVSMPRNCQSALVADALKAKRAVLSEKPMAMSVCEGEFLVATAAAHGTVWAIGYMKRHDPGVKLFSRLLQDLVENQSWGGILDVDMRDFCAAYATPIPSHERPTSSRPIRYAGGGVPDFLPPDRAKAYDYTVNVASHDINLLRFLFGEELKPVAMQVRRGGVQRAIFDAGQFGMALTLGPGDMGRWDQVLNVTFEKGRASLVLPSPMARQECASIALLHSTGRREHITVPTKDRIWSFEAQARSFAQSVMSGLQPANSGKECLADITFVESLWKLADWYQ